MLQQSSSRLLRPFKPFSRGEGKEESRDEAKGNKMKSCSQSERSKFDLAISGHQSPNHSSEARIAPVAAKRFSTITERNARGRERNKFVDDKVTQEHHQ
jgi:hypothetical protein